MSIAEKITRLSVRRTVALTALLMAAVYGADYVTGVELSFTLFYLLPISLVAWRIGLPWACATSLLAIALWLHADLSGGMRYSHPAIPLWNAGIRLGFFLIVSFLLDRIRAADRLKSDLVALVSHEFSNMLTPLKLACGMLRESEEGRGDPLRERAFLTIENSLTRLRTTVATFLNLTRMSSGRFRLEMRPTPVRELVDEAVAPLRPLIESRGQRLETRYPPQVLPVDADADALLLVLSNLLVNAVKYTPEGGLISVSVSLDPEDAQKVRVAVEDTGIGIAAEDRQRILDGYYRTAEGKSKAKGFGVGLFVSRDILESHGSALEIESEPGKGSRFFFRLPVWRGDSPQR